MVDEKKFKQALVSLRAFRSHIFGSITQGMVDEYHGIICTLQESSGEDLGQFAVPQSMMKPRPLSEIRKYRSTSFYNGESEIQYTSMQFCDKPFFTERMTELIEHFAEKPKAARGWQDT
jgi:hypothetical protein